MQVCFLCQNQQIIIIDDIKNDLSSYLKLRQRLINV
jgi:hypothetical protein